MAKLTLLKTKKVSRHFDGLKAVEKVSFELNAGEIRAIIGPNGAGKSTFVSLLSGRYPVTSGTVMFAGQDVTSQPAHQRVGLGIAYTFQITNIYATMTVLENICVAVQNRMRPNFQPSVSVRDAKTATEAAKMVLENIKIGLQNGYTNAKFLMKGGTPEAKIEKAAAKAAKVVGLGGMLDEVAGTLAYGHQRLLEVAMGLALKPKLLILDEPTQGLSDIEIENFKQVVLKINKNATVLLIEHNMDVVMSLADKITVLERGQILAEGTPSEIANNAAVQAAYLGESEE